MPSISQSFEILIILLMAGALVYFAVKIRAAMVAARSKLEDAADEEERYATMIAERAGLAPAEETPYAPPPVPARPAQGPLPREGQPVLSPTDAVVRQLTQLQVFDYREGEFPLSVPPNGVIYRMKKGGSALVLPRLESQEVLSHLVQRYDLVIVASATSDPLVIERLPSRLVSLVEMPGGGR